MPCLAVSRRVDQLRKASSVYNKQTIADLSPASDVDQLRGAIVCQEAGDYGTCLLPRRLKVNSCPCVVVCCPSPAANKPLRPTTKSLLRHSRPQAMAHVRHQQCATRAPSEATKLKKKKKGDQNGTKQKPPQHKLPHERNQRVKSSTSYKKITKAATNVQKEKIV